MKKFKRKIKLYREFIITTILLIGSMSIGIFVVWPGIQKALLLRKQVQTLAGEIEILRTKATLLRSLDEETLVQNLAELTTALPGDVSIASIFATIDGVISETGVIVGTYAVDSSAIGLTTSSQGKGKSDTSGVLSVPIDLAAKGTVDQVQQFITLIPKIRRLIRVHQVSLSVHENSVSASVATDIPYKKLPSAIGGPGSPLTPLSKKDEELLARVGSFQSFVSDSTQELAPQLSTTSRDPFAW